ncbi:uncharacterized protein LOC127852303 isoform X2 [Dreissena polymorpha]|uniref:Uncharacterized protein n=2 Tax=Dreissena polymorpha TaxID=45954 RepID=A0A9D4CNS0_DREPO|nr:uncharacterized protein LOC127852303 isoform X2 [Dreissena polymorpha]XP_052242194.1 uncharacterized protein LOC127852303 isoform X2 [Dreissena polymorpha]KAH3728086.1 hypothetical protein DPMN_054033 [Dreissena polymorpha]
MATFPKNHISMAGFYDWSTDEFDDSPMASVYQKIAVNHKNKLNKSNGKSWCSDGVHLNPGRMFVRDKATLTKGEQEIIAGIYKNRGDTSGKNQFIAQVRSHKDAWLVGKKLIRGKGGMWPEEERCSIEIPKNIFSRLDTQPLYSDRPYFCDKCKENCSVSDHCRREMLRNEERGDITGRRAPPVSPDDSPLTERKLPKQPKTNEGAVFVESGKTFYDPSEGSKKKKVYVDVFLPKFTTQSLAEESTSLTLVENDDKKSTSSIFKKDYAPKLFKISERSKENSDEGYSSQERSPVNGGKHKFSSPPLSRLSGKPESSLGD